MKHFAFVAIFLLGLIISCVPTVTPQSQTALGTATAQVPTVTPTPTPTLTETPTLTLTIMPLPTNTSTATVTPVPTRTATPTNTSTATVTPIPTRTATPTITPTPTQTPIPNFVWRLDFESGFGDAGTYNMKQGGIVDIIADPTSSEKGYVQRSTIGDGGNAAKEEQQGAWVYRLYPDNYFSFKPGSCEAEVDIWASKELVETTTQGGNHSVVLDLFDRTPQDGGEWHSALQAAVNRRSVSLGKVYLRLYHYPPGEIAPIQSTAPEFTAERWHNIRLVMGQNREATLYQDGLLVATGTMPTDDRLGTVGGHVGLYAYNWYTSSPPLKGMLLHDNWQIRCW